MFYHRKELAQPVNVAPPDARFGTYRLEQFGGATGELTAALQYWVQSFHVENAGIRDMLQDIAIEEFGHLEMGGHLIAQHTRRIDRTAVHDAPLSKLKGGGPHFLDSQGTAWTAACIQEGGDGRGPWSTEPASQYVADPTPQGGMPPPVNASDERAARKAPKPARGAR